MVSCDAGDKKKKGGKRRMGGKKEMKMKVCGSDGVTYDDKCKLGVEMHCNELKIVHMGSCDDCSKGTVCPWAGKMKKELEEKQAKPFQKLEELLKKASGAGVPEKKANKLEMVINKMKKKKEMFEAMLNKFGVKGKAVCDKDGKKYDSKCDFNIAKCEQFKLDKTILKPKRCEKPEEEKEEEEEEEEEEKE